MADILTKLALLLKDPRLGSDAKARAPVVRALGHLAAGAPSEPLREAYADILLAQTPPSAAEEFHFAVGESLCLAHSGVGAAVAKALLFSPAPTLAELRRTRELIGGLPGAATAPVAGGSVELKEKVLDGAIKRASSGTSDERAAASVWLVLLLVLCGEDEKMAKGLPRLQAALVALLAGDTSDLVQVLPRSCCNVLQKVPALPLMGGLLDSFPCEMMCSVHAVAVCAVHLLPFLRNSISSFSSTEVQ